MNVRALIPARLRERYGEEIQELLSDSRRPTADLLDIVRQSARWHLEGYAMNIWRTFAIVLATVSVFALGYAVNGLAGGISELPEHWWSGAPLLGLVGAGVLAAIGRLRGRSTGVSR